MLLNAVNDNGPCGSQFCALQVSGVQVEAEVRQSR